MAPEGMKSRTRARKSPTGSRKKPKTAQAKTRGTGKRDLVKAPNATFFAKRTGGEQFKDAVEVGASERADPGTEAKTNVRGGYGDRGDR